MQENYSKIHESGMESAEKTKRAASAATLTTPSELSADNQSANDHSIA